MKLNRIGSLLPLAETRVDNYFSEKIAVVLGPMAALHSRKRVLAQYDMIEDKSDQDAIQLRAREQDAEILAIDQNRRGYKARIRAAKTSIEIHSIMEELK